jgi:hypothetical protein
MYLGWFGQPLRDNGELQWGDLNQMRGASCVARHFGSWPIWARNR